MNGIENEIMWDYAIHVCLALIPFIYELIRAVWMRFVKYRRNSPTKDESDDTDKLIKSEEGGIQNAPFFEWRNLCVTIKDHGIMVSETSGSLERGMVCGIIGPSGSGKTLFLNALSQKSVHETHGEILLRGFPINEEWMRRHSSHVPCSPLTSASVSVGDACNYHCTLRHRNHPVGVERARLVQSALQALGIGHLEASKVSMLSTGERKRLDIVTQTFHSPKLLLLDEPTTGLSDGDALQLVRHLREVATNYGMAIIMIVHQPRMEVVESLDSMILAASKTISQPHSPKEIQALINTSPDIPSCPFGTALSAHLIDLIMDQKVDYKTKLFNNEYWVRSKDSQIHMQDVEIHSKHTACHEKESNTSLSFCRRLNTIFWYDVVKNRGGIEYYLSAAMISMFGVIMFAILFHRPILVFESMGGDFAKRLFCFFGMTLMFDFIMRFKNTTFNEDAVRYRIERYSLEVTPLTYLLGTMTFDLLYILLSSTLSVFLIRFIMRMDFAIASIVVWNALFNVFLQTTLIWNRLISFSGLKLDDQTSWRGFSHFIVIGYNGILLPVDQIAAWLSWLCYVNPLYYVYMAMMMFDGIQIDQDDDTGNQWNTTQYALMSVVELWICVWLHFVQLRHIHKWTM